MALLVRVPAQDQAWSSFFPKDQTTHAPRQCIVLHPSWTLPRCGQLVHVCLAVSCLFRTRVPRKLLCRVRVSTVWISLVHGSVCLLSVLGRRLRLAFARRIHRSVARSWSLLESGCLGARQVASAQHPVALLAERPTCSRGEGDDDLCANGCRASLRTCVAIPSKSCVARLTRAAGTVMDGTWSGLGRHFHLLDHWSSVAASPQLVCDLGSNKVTLTNQHHPLHCLDDLVLGVVSQLR